MSRITIDLSKARDTWYEESVSPKISINSSTIRFNKIAMDKYGLHGFKKAAIYISDDGFKLGIKPTNEEIDGAYTYSFNGDMITCQAALNELNVEFTFKSRQVPVKWDADRGLVVVDFVKAIKELSPKRAYHENDS